MAEHVFYNECEKHRDFASEQSRQGSQLSELTKTVLQDQREVHSRFNALDAKMDRQHERVTGEIVGLREAVTQAMLDKARSNGIEFGKAEVTGEIRQGLSKLGTVGKWVLAAIAALAGGAGVTEGIRRILGG